MLSASEVFVRLFIHKQKHRNTNALYLADLHYVLIGLALLGKMCLTGAFNTLYLLSTEIYPTVVRNAGMGSSSAVARIGSMIAPYIARSVNITEHTRTNV